MKPTRWQHAVLFGALLVQQPTVSLGIHHDTSQANALMPSQSVNSTTTSAAATTAAPVTASRASTSSASKTSSTATNATVKTSSMTARVASNGQVSVARDILVSGNVVAASIKASSATISGHLNTSSLAASGVVSATSATFDTIEASSIRAKSGGKIRLSGDVAISNVGPAASSFLSLDEIESVPSKTWASVYAENFDNNVTSEGKPQWTPHLISTCGGGTAVTASENRFLGGHCHFAANSTQLELTGLPSHEEIRFRANVHFIDQWNGETLFLRADGQVAWIDNCAAVPTGFGMNVCGGPSADAKLSQLVDVAVAHTSDFAVFEVLVMHGRDGCCLASGMTCFVFVRYHPL